MDSGAFPKADPSQVDLPSDAVVAALQECGFAPYEMTRYALWRCVTDTGMVTGEAPAQLSTDDIAAIVLTLGNSYRRRPPSTREFIARER